MSGSEEPGHPVPSPPKHPLTQPVPVQSAAGGPRPKRTRTRRRRRGRLPDRAVVFVGPMAAGKTSLGRRVARLLGVPFVDTDAVFVRRYGAIVDFFASRGEAEFRRIEAEIIVEELAAPGARIVALGGGAVITESTRKLLRDHPVILLMTTQAAVLRTANLERRPLLRDDPESWGRILEARKPFYDEVADVTFRTDRATKDQLVQRVAGWIRGQGRPRRGGRTGGRRAAAPRAGTTQVGTTQTDATPTDTTQQEQSEE